MIHSLSFAVVIEGTRLQMDMRTFLREKWAETWSFSVELIGNFVVLSDVKLDGKTCAVCYGCNVFFGFEQLVRKNLVTAGVPEDQPVILVWPGDFQCWDGARAWLSDQNGLIVRAYLWDELRAKLPSTLAELAKQANDAAMVRFRMLMGQLGD